MPPKKQEIPIGLKIGIGAFCGAILLLIGVLVASGPPTETTVVDPNAMMKQAQKDVNEAMRLKHKFESMRQSDDRQAVMAAWEKAYNKLVDAQKKMEEVYYEHATDADGNLKDPKYQWIEEEIQKLQLEIQYLIHDKPVG